MGRLLAIDWSWWLETVPIRVDWWNGADYFWYFHLERCNVLFLAIAAVLVALIFFLTCLKRSGIEIVINSLWR